MSLVANWHYSQQTVFSCFCRKNTGVTNNVNDAVLCKFPVNQPAEYQEPENEAAKWNAAIVYFITCAFPSATS